jgi:hypothetical protein
MCLINGRKRNMRAVFINHCPPNMRHVCAVRMREFACAFALRGHQVILFTESLGDNFSNVSPENLPTALSQHDWKQPYYLSIKPIPDRMLSRLRDGELGWVLRKAIITLSYVFKNGLYEDWQRGAEPYLIPLSDAFVPEIIWASFGNTGVWNIAQRLSKYTGCPWVADIKDNWQNFIPFGLRKLVASRFKNAGHMTSFSKSHMVESNLWFQQNKTPIYSGFDNAILDINVPVLNDTFEILLTGSIYGQDDFQTFIFGLEHWLRNRDSKKPVRFIYAGNDHQRVQNGVQNLRSLCEIHIKEFLDIGDLLVAQRHANINAYIRLPSRFHFHHKAIELMAAQRPIICFPKEVDETIEIIRQIGGALYSCGSIEDVSKGFDTAYKNLDGETNNSILSEYSWQGQASVLEKIFEGTRSPS